MLILVCRIGIDCSTCLKLVELEFIFMQRVKLLKITLDLLELIVDLLDQLECFIFLIFLPFFEEKLDFFDWKSSESKSCRAIRA